MEEITAEYESAALVGEVHVRRIPKVTVACKTDLGRVRENNEDKFEYYLPEDKNMLARRGQVFVVCDGMGGHAAGQIASELTAKTFIDVYLGHPAEDPAAAMEAGVSAAHRYVCEVGRAVPARRGMGTTLSALILIQDQAHTVQVGDSRVYRLRAGALEQLTRDHTWIEEAVRNGFLRREEADTHPHRHVLTRAIGGEGEVRPDIETRELEAGDTYLVCSDGLLNHVPDQAIGRILSENAPSEACWKLVGQALLGGGSDNCTVLVVRVDELLEP